MQLHTPIEICIVALTTKKRAHNWTVASGGESFFMENTEISLEGTCFCLHLCQKVFAYRGSLVEHLIRGSRFMRMTPAVSIRHLC